MATVTSASPDGSPLLGGGGGSGSFIASFGSSLGGMVFGFGGCTAAVRPGA
ncbi:MAG: hypothetical protein WDN23_09105 [Edaphobacter sp.]